MCYNALFLGEKMQSMIFQAYFREPQEGEAVLPKRLGEELEATPDTKN